MTDLDTIESIDLYEYCGGLYCATRTADGWEHGMLTEPCRECFCDSARGCNDEQSEVCPNA